MPARASRGWVALLRAAWSEYELDHARYLAAAMVYYASVSLVPLVLLLLAALGLALRFSTLARHARDRVVATVESSLGPALADPIQRVLDDLSRGSIVATAVSLVVLLVTASGLFVHLRLGFRAIWGHEPPLAAASIGGMVRQSILERGVAFLMVVGGAVLLLASSVVVGATQSFNRALGNVTLVGQVGGWLLTAVTSFGLTATTFAVLLTVLPPVRVRLADVAPAALLCGAVTVVAEEVLALYGALAVDTPSAYGLVGGLLALMLWMNVVGQVLFFGAEVTKVHARWNVASEPSYDESAPVPASPSLTRSV